MKQNFRVLSCCWASTIKPSPTSSILTYIQFFTGNKISRENFKGLAKKDEVSNLKRENCALHLETGPEAIRTLLSLVNIEQELVFLEFYFGSSTGPNEKQRADWQFSAIMGKEFTLVQDKAAFLVRKYELLQYFKEKQISPSCLVTDCIPIPPITDEDKPPEDLLYLYADLILSSKRLGRLRELNAPNIIILNEIHILQKKYEEVIHSRVINNQMRHGLLDMITDQMIVKFESDTGSVYWGPIKDGRHMNGTGIIALHNGTLYVGQFKDDEVTGYGRLYSLKGGYMEGLFYEGKYNFAGFYKNSFMDFFENNGS